MLNDGGFKLETLGEKTSVNLVLDELDEHTQHAFSKLDNTHLAMHDNKTVHWVQPIVAHFVEMEFGWFMAVTKKSKMSFGTRKLYPFDKLE